jgi:hypothetical protein
VIPVSDSGKAEEGLACGICFSFDRGFIPIKIGMKITFRNHGVFGYFLMIQKVTEEQTII